jgi:hypothetical protein
MNYFQCWKIKFFTIELSMFAFILLFFAETSYYLLILQTGIVEYYHTDIHHIWMIPVGGVLGILTIAKLQHRSTVVLVALLLQTLLMFFYPAFNPLVLFILGYLSGLVAPYLIYQLKSVEQVVVILGLSYLLGTIAIAIDPAHRGTLAVVLSLLAAGSAYFVKENTSVKKPQSLALKTYGEIFIWLVLDASLFGMLASSDVAIWGDVHYMSLIIFFHGFGLYVGYKLYHYQNNPKIILGLFLLSYLLFWLDEPYLLAMVYPVVISYYNVIILKYFMRLSFGELALASVSLWVSAGAGLALTLIYSQFN